MLEIAKNKMIKMLGGFTSDEISKSTINSNNETVSKDEEPIKDSTNETDEERFFRNILPFSVLI